MYGVAMDNFDFEFMLDTISGIVNRRCTLGIGMNQGRFVLNAGCFIHGHGEVSVSSEMGDLQMSKYPEIMLQTKLEILAESLKAFIEDLPGK
jgi:hypothetical protein